MAQLVGGAREKKNDKANAFVMFFYACNNLIFIVLQKVIFYMAKDDLFMCKTSPFGE